jgi:sugar lactone lactonase YvrE
VTLSVAAYPQANVLQYVATTLAGNVMPGEGVAGSRAYLLAPTAVAIDAAGNLYIADSGNRVVRRLSASGTITTFAGNGMTSLSGDGGPATAGSLGIPSGIVVDSKGNVYVSTGSAVRRITPSGELSTIAGGSTAGFSGDDGPATLARLSGPGGMAFDAIGNLYIADSGNHRIRKVAPDGKISTVAGDGSRGNTGDNGPATKAALNSPEDVALDASGNLYISDRGNGRLRGVTSAGTISSITFTGMSSPYGLAIDGKNNLLITDVVTRKVFQRTPTGTVTTVAGTGQVGYSGDGGMATAAMLEYPVGIAVDQAGAIFFADQVSHRVRRISTSGAISNAAGQGRFGGDGGSAIDAALQNPVGVALDRSGNLYVADASNYRIRKISATGTITTIAGDGVNARSPDGAAANRSSIAWPGAVAVDKQGNVYFSEPTVGRIRKIDTTGILWTVAGGGTGGDGSLATSAQLTQPYELLLDDAGNLYFTDRTEHRIRKVSTDGRISTLAGTGKAGFNGDGGLATAAQLSNPRGLALDAAGRLYLSDMSNVRIRVISTAGIITTFAGGGTGSADGPATGSITAYGLAVDATGNLFTAETSRIRVISGNTIRTIAGTGLSGYSGDGGIATAAQIYCFSSIVSDDLGALIVADNGNHRIRKIVPNRLTDLKVLSGNNQTGDTGSVLPVPLKVSAMGSGGVAVSGVTVTFTVESGSAKLSASSVPTGPDGVAGVAVTLGAEAGEIEIRAAAAGLAAIRFTLKSVPGGSNASSLTSYLVRTIAGSYNLGDGGPADRALLLNPNQLAVDKSGNLFIADSTHNRIRKVSPEGVITTVAGNGTPTLSGDGGPAVEAGIANPMGLAVDGTGNLYILQNGFPCVRKVTPDGIITTIAGTGSNGYRGDGGPASEAQFSGPLSLAADSAGNLYIADSAAYRVRRIGTDGIIQTVAGTGTWGFSGDGESAKAAQIERPFAVAVNEAGELFIGTGNRVRKVAANGTITTVAGVGAEGFGGDGGPATAANLNEPAALVFDVAGNLFVADSLNHRIRKVTPAGVISTVAGSGLAASGGDGPDALNAHLHVPYGLAIDHAGNVYISEGDSVRALSTAGVIRVAAGRVHCEGDGGPAVSALFSHPLSLALEGSGSLYVTDSYNHRIRKIDAGGNITTVAGDGIDGFGGDGKPGTEASLSSPVAIVLDPSGNLYIADYGSNRVRKLSAAGIITTVAGNGKAGFSGDGGPATLASLYGPWGLALDAAGNLLVSEYRNHRIRRISTDGTITTIAGTGAAGFSGDGGAARLAQLRSPRMLAIDPNGTLYVADSSNYRIRSISPDGIISTVVGTGISGVSGDGGLSNVAGVGLVLGLAMDSERNLYFSDSNRIRVVNANGLISALAGIGSAGFGGDGGPAGEAVFNAPSGLAIAADGTVFVADQMNHRIRTVAKIPKTAQ